MKNIFETDKQKYKCKRCNKIFEAIAYKSDNQAACPYCPGIGNRINCLDSMKQPKLED